MPRRPRHPKKEIESALRYGEQQGFELVLRHGKGHLWGRLIKDGATIAIYGTPRNTGNDAKRIRRAVDRIEQQRGENNHD